MTTDISNEWDIKKHVENLGKPYKFIRLGDGQMRILEGKNLREHDYFSGMIADMQKMMRNEQAVFGVQRTSQSYFGYDYPNGDVFHYASKNGELRPFIKKLRRLNTVFISPPFHKKLNIYKQFIEIPERNCYLKKEEIKRAILKTKADVYCFHASMLSGILISELPLIGSMLDLGSLWDVYAGKPSRSYQHKMNLETIKKNYE